ncbi:hemerythrin HHE cation binding domain-containing protein [Lapillicoccus jejuensis]|uniref:Hemerythrin HHE cation binding domain-containing protein n=1 Tax=Lapillicoccus jejuensis TaxID=402171 RepID=A0A542DZK0_9MICO|nr:hemerythrin HHE cation binding domain-containing protein [Lapillicoccus jejuensis]
MSSPGDHPLRAVIGGHCNPARITRLASEGASPEAPQAVRRDRFVAASPGYVGAMDITEVILHQHMEQRRMFAMLEEWPRDDTEGLSALWTRLAILLETHAEGEERYFYPELLHRGEGGGDADDVEEETEDAVKDHNKIRDAVRRVGDAQVGSDGWWEAVTDANVENSDHMAEEERQDLTDFRLHADLALRHDLAVKFLRFEAMTAARGIEPVDKDPEEWIEEHQGS